MNTIFSTPTTPLLPGYVPPSPELIEALKSAMSHAAVASAQTQQRAGSSPSSNRPPFSATSYGPGSPSSQRSAPPPPRTLTAMVVLSDDGWATGEDAQLIIEEKQISTVVSAEQQHLSFLRDIGQLPEHPFVLIEPDLLASPLMFIEIIKEQADIVFDISDYFYPIPAPRNFTRWEYRGNMGLPQRMLDAIYAQETYLDNLTRGMPSFLSDIARPIGCDAADALYPLLSRSRYAEDVRDMLDAIKFYSFPHFTGTHWISIPRSLISEDAAWCADMREIVTKVLDACVKDYKGGLNVLMPTDTRREFREYLARLGDDMGAVERFDEAMDTAKGDEGDA